MSPHTYKDLKFDYGRISGGTSSVTYNDKHSRFNAYEKSESGGKFRSINTKGLLKNLKKSMNIYGEAGAQIDPKETAQILN